MTSRARNSLLLAAATAIAAISAHAQQNQSGEVYRWVDDEGVVHYGDRVPPEHSKRDRDVLNDQGVRVGSEQGEITPDERAAMEREEQRRQERQRELTERAQRDRMLLETYLSVEDIKNLRDRRLELLESRIQVTQLYLSDLRERLAELEKLAQRYAPYNEDEGAPPLPDDLSSDMSRTRDSIEIYEQRLEKSRTEQQQVRDSFAADIERFRELKGEDAG